MAILHACPNLTVEIVVNRVALQEYDDNEDEQGPADTITKFIEADSDTNFAIRTKINGSLPARKFLKRVFLDGVQVRSSIYKSYTYNVLLLDEGRMCQVGRQSVRQNYRFRDMAIGKLCSAPMIRQNADYF